MKSWFDDHAAEFADADVIEHAFVGEAREFQERLNLFKLWALDRIDHVSLNGKHVIEFGAGHGRLAFAYPGMASYIGLDSSKSLVTLGNERLQRAGLSSKAKLLHADVMSFDGPRRHFDVVCSLGMVGYFRDPAPVVTQMEIFLRPGGIFFFDFRVLSWPYALVRRAKWALYPPTGGKSFLTEPDKLEALLCGLGLTNVRIRLRDFPFLPRLYASGNNWALTVRNAFSESRLLRPLAIGAWIFADKPPIA